MVVVERCCCLPVPFVNRSLSSGADSILHIFANNKESLNSLPQYESMIVVAHTLTVERQAAYEPTWKLRRRVT